MKLLLDTNLLTLLIAGFGNPALIGTHRRLRDYDVVDFNLIAGLALETPNHVSTPHVLAETSNFLGSGTQQMFDGAADALGRYIWRLEEVFEPAKTIVALPEYAALGLTDATIVHIATANIRVVSVDYHLCNRLHAKGIDAVNPRNMRAL